MPQHDNHLYKFGEFSLDARERALYRSNELIPLTPKALETLLALVRNAGRVVSKEDLMQEVWPGTFVEEGNLNVNIFALRKALGPSADGNGYIETVPKRGFRLVAPVSLEEGAKSPLFVETRTRARIVTEEIEEIPTPAELAPPSPRALPSGQTAERFGRGWLVAGALLALAALIAAGGYLAGDFLRSRTNPLEPRIMLGVLPFLDLSGNPEQEYLSDGFTEEIISQLGNLNPSRLGVIARTSAMTYKNTNKSVNQIGRELRVEYIVEGSVRRFDNRIRVTAQLVRTSDQTHLWAESYDRDIGNILKLEEDVARSIAQAIRVQLEPPEREASSTRPLNTEAYEDYLKGRYYVNQRHGAAVLRSIESYSQAVTKDPYYARAYAGLADAYLLRGLFSVRTIDVMPKAESAAAKALELDANLAEAHTSMAGVKALYDWDWRGAEKEYNLALNLNPDDARAHHSYAVFYCIPLGRKQEAIEHMEHAMKLDPLSPIIATDLGWAYYLAGQTDRGVAQYKKALELDVHFVSALDRIAQAYEEKGMYKEMLATNEANSQFNTEIATAMRRGYERAGYQGALKAEMETMEKRVRGGQVYDPYSFAFVYAKLGEYDRAIEHLEKSFEERNPGMVYMNVDPPFKPLRGDVRFQSLEGHVGLIP